MILSDFHIGLVFRTGGGLWRCTDVGTRVVVAIRLDDGHDSSWHEGPPYAVVEHVFAEDMGGCEVVTEEPA